MGRRNKVVKNAKIETIAAEGRGLARVDGKVIFVDYGIPGDVADIWLKRNKKDFAEGTIHVLHEASPLRVPAFCDHFWHCGGCRWQHLAYADQLKFKAQVVEEAFRRVGKQSGYETLPILGCAETRGYRNKMEYTFSDQGWFTDEQIRSGQELERRAVGFHVAGQYQRVVNIDKCHLQDTAGNAVRDAVYSYALEHNLSFFNHREKKGLLRNLIIRQTTLGEMMVLVSFGAREEDQIDGLLSFLEQTFPGINALLYVINEKGNDTIYDLDVAVYKGADHIVEQLGPIRYRIGGKSFFQTNSAQAKLLYDGVVEFAGLQQDDLVYDLYTGIGSIALYVADQCRRVIGVETVPEAIADAWENAKLNDIENVHFEAGSSERILSKDFLDEHGRPDVVITDPPRAGMHRDVIDFLLEAAPRKIVYVSCNPVTQARDVAMLAPAYRLVKIQPVDMFPHTYHIENIALLERV